MKSVEVAEKASTPLVKGLDKNQEIFMWQNNLLKFYLEHNVEKAIDYSKELLDDYGQGLDEKDIVDLKFSLSTAYLLEGSPELLEPAKDLMKETLACNDPLQRGYIHNNLGMTHFYDFAIRSSQITDPQQHVLEEMKPIIENFEDGIINLKKSIHAFEMFEERFKPITEANPSLEGKEEGVDLELVKQKLFVDELFDV